MSYADIEQIPAKDWHCLTWLVANQVIGWDADVRVPFYLAMILDVLIRANSTSKHPKPSFDGLFAGHVAVELKPDTEQEMEDYIANLGKRVTVE